MYKRNNNGSKTEPCGTLYLIGSVDELIPCIETYCCLLERYDENKLKTVAKGPTKTCRSARSTRTASGAIELLLKAAGTQGAQGTRT